MCEKRIKPPDSDYRKAFEFVPHPGIGCWVYAFRHLGNGDRETVIGQIEDASTHFPPEFFYPDKKGKGPAAGSDPVGEE